MLKPGKIRCMLEISSTNVGTEHMAELDKEITPILAELITLGLENDEHPTVKRLFNWLVAPNRTGKEFYYVVGPLQEYVLKVMMEHFGQYVESMRHVRIPSKYLGKMAAEALAVICPVLEGAWEQAVWVLLGEDFLGSADDYGHASDKLTAWIFHVIGDHALCPNPYLRYELIYLLAMEVEPLKHKSFRPKAVESFLSACSSLNINYLMESKPQYGYYHHMDMGALMDCLNCITIDIGEEFDESLANKLQNVKLLRLSAQVHDVACHYAVNSNKFEEPMMLYGLTAILQTIYDFIKLNYIDYQNENSDLFSHFTGIDYTTYWLKVFINNFTKSCLTPHLIGLIATCILTTMEIAMSEYASNESRESLSYIKEMLEDLFDEQLFNPEIESRENMILMVKYQVRLKHLMVNYG